MGGGDDSGAGEITIPLKDPYPLPFAVPLTYWLALVEPAMAHVGTETPDVPPKKFNASPRLSDVTVQLKGKANTRSPATCENVGDVAGYCWFAPLAYAYGGAANWHPANTAVHEENTLFVVRKPDAPPAAL